MASAHQRSFGALSSASQPRCQQEWIHEQELHRICRQEQHGAPVGDGAGSTVRRREGAVRRRGWRNRGGGGVASAVEGVCRVAGAVEELARQRGRRGWRGGGAGGPAEWMDAELSAYAKKANGGRWMDSQVQS